MIRFLFPKVSFSGRLSRLGFWREIMISAITTPLAVGVVTYLAHEGARAAESGLVVDNANAKAAVGFLLMVYAVRNLLVFAGVVRRRLNDLGLEGMRVFKPAVPLFLFFGMLFLAGLISQAPSVPGKEIAVSVATFALVAVFWWQIARVLNLGYQVMFGRSGALAGLRTAPTISEAISKPMPRDAHKAFADLRGRFDAALKDLKNSGGGKPHGFEAIDRFFAPAIDALNDWAKPAPAGEAKAVASKTPRDTRVDSRPPGRETRGEVARGLEKAHSKPAYSARKPSQVVSAARREPQTGRSRWYSGILSGPWG